MKYQILFSGKNNRTIINLSAEFAQRVVKVKFYHPVHKLFIVILSHNVFLLPQFNTTVCNRFGHKLQQVHNPFIAKNL